MDFIHKLTARIVRELTELGSRAILENLKRIKSRVLSRSREMDRSSQNGTLGSSCLSIS